MARVNDGRAQTNEARLPSEQELAIRRNFESRATPSIPKRISSGRGGYAMTAEDAIAAASVMERTEVVSPFAGLPVSASVGQFKEAQGFFGDRDGSGGMWDEYFDEDQGGYKYKNLAGTVRSGTRVPGEARTAGRGRQPAAISILPTSTTNPDRPRTVAAGYDGGRGVLTVVFRDGTFYNYYDVSEDEWGQFKSSYSKGRYIMAVLDGKPRGTARMANVSLAAREGLYRIARTGQWVNDGQVSGQFDRNLPPRLNPTRSRRRSK
jgi:hypothetical protein